MVPNTFVSAKSAAFGAVLTVIFFGIASSVFSLYPIYFTSLKMIYGALVALPLLLIWLHIVWVIVLLGAIVSHRLDIGFDVNRKNNSEGDTQIEKFEALEQRRKLPVGLFQYIYDEKENPQGTSIEKIEKKFKSPIWVEVFRAIKRA